MPATITRVDGDESAVVTISDGTHECIAHCFPYKAIVGRVVIEPLSAFDGDEPSRLVGHKIGFEKLDAGYFAYRVVGRVVDVSKGIVAVGDILIDIGRLPGDIEKGDIVVFDCIRLDTS